MNLLPAKLAAKKCGISKSSFYEWTHEGLLPPAVVVKGRKFWRDDELDSWILSLPRVKE